MRRKIKSPPLTPYTSRDYLWFAWHPVFCVDTGEVVWWEWVFRYSSNGLPSLYRTRSLYDESV